MTCLNSLLIFYLDRTIQEYELLVLVDNLSFRNILLMIYKFWQPLFNLEIIRVFYTALKEIFTSYKYSRIIEYEIHNK